MSRVEMHSVALRAIRDGAVAGLYQKGLRIIEENRSHVPDAPPYGVGLVETGRVVVYLDGRKVRDSVPDQGEPEFDVPSHGLALFVGYGFPARLLEYGTVKMPPHPFVTGAVAPGLEEPGREIAPAVEARLR